MFELTSEFLDYYVNITDPRDQISVARRLTPSQKLAVGGLLFDRERMMIETLIRRTFPEAEDEVVKTLVRAAIVRLHDEPG